MKIEIEEVKHIAETTLTIRGTRRRTTIPKDIVTALDLKNGDKIRWMLFHDGRIMVMKLNPRE